MYLVGALAKSGGSQCGYLGDGDWHAVSRRLGAILTLAEVPAGNVGCDF